MQQIIIVFLETLNVPASLSGKEIFIGRTKFDATIIAGVSKIEEINICHLSKFSTEADLLPKK